MPRSILLVDDDAAVRMPLRQLLVQEGFVVHAANDGQQALQVLERIDPPDVILLDYRMPVMDGKQCLTAIRGDPRFRDIPVVLMSAWTREWSGARLEVAEVLMKPVDIELLLTTVRELCSDSAGKHKREN